MSHDDTVNDDVQRLRKVKYDGPGDENIATDDDDEDDGKQYSVESIYRSLHMKQELHVDRH